MPCSGIADRGRAVTAMSEALTRYPDVTQGCRRRAGARRRRQHLDGDSRRCVPCPSALPKLMVSTMASGNVAAYVGPTDIAMMHAVADVAGLNAITRKVIGNAAHAAAGMALNAIPEATDGAASRGPHHVWRHDAHALRRSAISWTRVASASSFMPPGTGGQCMEKLIDSGLDHRPARHHHDGGGRPSLSAAFSPVRTTVSAP